MLRNSIVRLALVSVMLLGAATPCLAHGLDILVVVDNSRSMRQEQANLGSRLGNILRSVHHRNWRIAVTTTDRRDACVTAVIEKGDPEAAQKFYQAVNAGASGSYKERGLMRTVEALNGSCLSEPWLRERSRLAILIASDEDNCSRAGEDCLGSEEASPEYLLSHLAQIRRPGRTARVYGLIWHPRMPKAHCPTGFNRAHVYADVIKRTRGTWGSICGHDFADSLDTISADMESMLSLPEEDL